MQTRIKQLTESGRASADALQETRELLTRAETQLQQATDHNTALNASYTERMDDLLVAHGRQVDELQRTLDQAVAERAALAQRLMTEEVGVRDAHQMALDEAAQLRAKHAREVATLEADFSRKSLDTEQRATQQLAELETDGAKAAALYGAEIAQLAREYDLEQRRAESVAKQAAEAQQEYAQYVEKMQLEMDEAQQQARNTYRSELQTLQEKYQEELGVMVALDKNRARQSIVAMKRLQTASARAQDDSRGEFDREVCVCDKRTVRV